MILQSTTEVIKIMLYKALIRTASIVTISAERYSSVNNYVLCISVIVLLFILFIYSFYGCVFLLTMKQLITMRFFVKNEIIATKTFETVYKAYSATSLNCTTIFEQHRPYRNDRKSVNDDPQERRP